MTLNSLQNEIFELVRSDGESDCPLVVSDRKLRASERLRTYQRSSYLKADSCLRDDYQVTGSLLGQEKFDQIIKSYLHQYPADTHFINEVGKHFPDFLAKHIREKELPFLKDLAALEWTRVESFYNFFDFRRDLENPNQIHPNPSIVTLKSQWPLDLIWHEETTHPEKPTEVFIWTTADRRVHVSAWAEKETKIIKVILKSFSLSQATEELLCDFEPDQLTSLLTANLSTWVRRGLFEIKIMI